MNTDPSHVTVRLLEKGGSLSAPVAPPKVVKSEDEWRAQLTEEQFRVTRADGTERPFCGLFHDHHKDGVYHSSAATRIWGTSSRMPPPTHQLEVLPEFGSAGFPRNGPLTFASSDRWLRSTSQSSFLRPGPPEALCQQIPVASLPPLSKPPLSPAALASRALLNSADHPNKPEAPQKREQAQNSPPEAPEWQDLPQWNEERQSAKEEQPHQDSAGPAAAMRGPGQPLKRISTY